MKFPYLHLQLWDRDIVKWNDCAGVIEMMMIMMIEMMSMMMMMMMMIIEISVMIFCRR